MDLRRSGKTVPCSMPGCALLIAFCVHLTGGAVSAQAGETPYYTEEQVYRSFDVLRETNAILDPASRKEGLDVVAFLDILRENDEMVQAQELFNRLRAKVVVNADQTPEYSDIFKAGHNGGDFLFVRRVKQ